MAAIKAGSDSVSSLNPPTISAIHHTDHTDLFPVFLTSSTAGHDQPQRVSHQNGNSNNGDKGGTFASITIAETGSEFSLFEKATSRSSCRSLHSSTTKYEDSVSLKRKRKDLRAALNSFIATLPIACRGWRSRLTSLVDKDQHQIVPICPSLPARQPGPKMESFPLGRVPSPTAAATAAAKNMAFAFDIDGVLVHGERLIPEARRAFQILNGDNSLGIRIPHIFLTNGGGKIERDRCAQLTQILDTGTEVSINQFIQSHTPMQALRECHSAVLIIGGEGDKCKSIAKSYGFRNVVVPYDIVAWDPTIAPFKKLSPSELAAAEPQDFSKINIDAILVFSSSRDYGTDLQIIMDLLRSSHGRLGTVARDPVSQRIPIYFSHGDLVFPNQHFQPRMSQGTFRIALEAMYKTLTGVELERVVYGKPETEAYTYAEGVLAAWMEDLYGAAGKVPENVYMVGDNPASDILGGNQHGWKTCLVRTGIFQGIDNDAEHPASFGVFDHVLGAVAAALKSELGEAFRFD